MKRLLQVFARSIGFAHDPEVPAGSAERPLRVLLVASIVLPVLLFAAVSVISYRQHFVDARDRLERDLGRVTEHALKVFETFELSAAYLDEMLSNVTDEEIRQSEREYSVLAATRSDRRRLVERSDFGVRYCQAAIIFSLVIGIASRNVCIGVLPKHQRP